MFLRMNYWLGVLLLLFAGTVYAVTQQEIQAFQQMSPSEQQSLLNSIQGGGGSGSSTTQTQLQPSPVAPAAPSTTTVTPSVRVATPPAALTVQPGDTLILTLTSAAALTTSSTPGFAEQTAGPLDKLLGSHVIRVHRNGSINILGMLQVPVAGLSPADVAARLEAEPLFAGYQVTVKLLPLQPTGPKALQPFGYDVFSGTTSTFAPATDIPVPANYVIGPDDTIQVQLYGKDNQQYSLVVTRDGVINFPSLGPITVAGLNYDQMKRLLKKRVARQLIGDQASITMGPLRSIQVYILGDVQRPGSYTVSSLSTMTNALFVSGGITPVGSLRDIQLKRDGRVVRRLDLYDLLLHGDTGKDRRLLPGDVIFVPPVGDTVGVYGEVKRPAIYELRNERTVGQVLAMAGGLLPTAAPSAVQIQRIEPNGNRTVLDVDAATKKGADTQVRDGDMIDVQSVLARRHDYVRLAGYVERPGLYQWHQGMRLTDLLPSLDLLPPQADLNYVLIKRELPPDDSIEVLSARLNRALAHPDSSDNVLLQPRDEVMVFNQSDDRSQLIEPIIDELKAQARLGNPEQIVHVSGDVAFPGAYPLQDDMRVSDLIRAGGGLSQQAYTLNAELVRYKIVDNRLRETKRLPIDLAAVLHGDRAKDLALRPFDTLSIKRMPDWYKSRLKVTVKGEVVFPGTYIIKKGETLGELMERVGGLTKWAFPSGAVFMRKDLQAREQAQLNALHDRLKADMAAMTLQQSQLADLKSGSGINASQSVAMAQGLMNQLETTKATGRLVINLPAIMAGDPNSDVTLQDGDKLYVPEKPQSVTVIGEVNFPTSLLYNPNYNLDDYIKHAGGFTYKADKGRTYVVRADGAVIASESSFFGDTFPANIRVGDTIVVPVDVERMSPMLYWTSISQIMYQLGVAAASWHAVGLF